MRIIAGTARRTELAVAPETSARPFLELARGALFNSLAPRLEEALVLDVYAGSGALGLEALSRGARSCVFVEQDAAACRTLTANAGACRLSGRTKIIRGDAEKVLAAEKNGYDLIFLDPPFPELGEWKKGGRAEGVMREAARLLHAGGILVFRLEDARTEPPDWPGLSLAASRKYGRSRVCKYVHAGNRGDDGNDGD